MMLSEHVIQTQFITMVDALLPENQSRLIYAVPNGGKRHPVVAAKLKAEGVRKGMPDINIDIPIGIHSGMRIEFKSSKGRVEPHQKEIHDLLRQQFYVVEIHRDAASAFDSLMGYLRGKK